jgi:hypothetical protein
VHSAADSHPWSRLLSLCFSFLLLPLSSGPPAQVSLKPVVPTDRSRSTFRPRGNYCAYSPFTKNRSSTYCCTTWIEYQICRRVHRRKRLVHAKPHLESSNSFSQTREPLRFRPAGSRCLHYKSESRGAPISGVIALRDSGRSSPNLPPRSGSLPIPAIVPRGQLEFWEERRRRRRSAGILKCGFEVTQDKL